MYHLIDRKTCNQTCFVYSFYHYSVNRRWYMHRLCDWLLDPARLHALKRREYVLCGCQPELPLVVYGLSIVVDEDGQLVLSIVIDITTNACKRGLLKTLLMLLQYEWSEKVSRKLFDIHDTTYYRLVFICFNPANTIYCRAHRLSG